MLCRRGVITSADASAMHLSGPVESYGQLTFQYSPVQLLSPGQIAAQAPLHSHTALDTMTADRGKA